MVPLEFRHYKELKNFYKPYTLKGYLFWEALSRIGLFRNILSKLSSAKIDEAVLEFLRERYDVFAVNRGTTGETNTLTVIAKGDLGWQFLKIIPESKIHLLQAEMNASEMFSEYNWFIGSGYNERIHSTTLAWIVPYFHLERVGFKIYCQEILEILNDLILLGSKNSTILSHGDFTAWNLFKCNDVLVVIDWETLEYRLPGFDIFTYVFKSQFLLFGRFKSSNVMWSKLLFSKYFELLGITDWVSYLNMYLAKSNNELGYNIDREEVRRYYG